MSASCAERTSSDEVCGTRYDRATGIGVPRRHGLIASVIERAYRNACAEDARSGGARRLNRYRPDYHAGMSTAPTEAGNRFRILVVDDNADLVTSTVALLESAGYVALPACSAREAVDLLDDEAGRIDLVLSDIRMPDVDGFDLLRVLRHRFPTLPIILMSGLPVTSDDVVPSGATILTKPFDAAQLEEAIEQKLQSRAQKRV